jgi:hypothetical protein
MVESPRTQYPLLLGQRRTSRGKWTSKLGRWQDIEHELEGLVCEMYGTVQQILKRPGVQ